MNTCTALHFREATYQNADSVSLKLSLYLFFFCASDFSVHFSQIFTIFNAAALLWLFGSVFLNIHVMCFLLALDCNRQKIYLARNCAKHQLYIQHEKH